MLGISRIDPDLPEDEAELLQNYRKADERGKKRILSAAKEEAEENSPKSEAETA